MVDTSALRVVTAYQDAWTSRNFEAAAQLVAEDIVFRSPLQHISGAADLFNMLHNFVGRVAPRWQLVSAAETEQGVLVLYHLFSHDEQPLACADYFTVSHGRINSETLVFDAEAFGAAASRPQPGKADPAATEL